LDLVGYVEDKSLKHAFICFVRTLTELSNFGAVDIQIYIAREAEMSSSRL